MGTMESCSPETSPPPGFEILDPSSPPMPPPPLPPSLPEKGQMVCGSCRELLSYLKGAVHVQCACCQAVNFVLEAHQVGNLKCGNCSLLLMYPYGAPAVRCSSCCHVTEIGAHNSWLSLSAQQDQTTPVS